MDEVRAMNKIEANLPREKIDYINETHQKESQYWKKIAVENRNEDERKQLTGLAPLKVFLARKDAVKNEKNVNEISFYLKNQYSHTMKSEELLLKTFQVKKTNLHLKQNLIP